MKLIIICISLIFFSFQLKAQNTQAFDFVNFSKSVSGFGKGWQGVASLSNDDALVYNPANLAFTKNTKLSFYRNPFQMIGFANFPLTSLTVYHKEDKIGAFGLSYENRDFGEVRYSTSENPDGFGETFHYYERSFSAGYARNLSDNLIAGIQFRYSFMNLYETSPEGYFISLGLNYIPESLNKKFNFGFALMNLGPAVKYEFPQNISVEKIIQYDPPPTKLNLGVNFISAENEYFILPLALSISKPFDEREDNGDGQSSFKTIFTDWSDFPNDLSLHTGLSFIWKPLRLDKSFSFFQEFYIGNFSDGIKTHLQNFYTHGANIGFEFYGYKLTMGYSGVAHNVHYPNYLQWVFPYETFQFSFEVNDNLLFHRENYEENKSLLDKVTMSLGVGETVRVGVAKGFEENNSGYSMGNNLSYSFEATFYFDERNALISSLTYNSVPFEVYFNTFTFLESKFETFSFFSSYRYHPLESFNYLFIQGGMGITRWNPVVRSSPRYDYKTALQLSTGLTLDFWKPVVFTPYIDYNILFFPTGGSAPRIQGHNLFNFALKVGIWVL